MTAVLVGLGAILVGTALVDLAWTTVAAQRRQRAVVEAKLRA